MACKWADSFALADVALEMCEGLDLTDQAYQAMKLFKDQPSYERCYSMAEKRMTLNLPTTPDEIALFCAVAVAPGPGIPVLKKK